MHIAIALRSSFRHVPTPLLAQQYYRYNPAGVNITRLPPITRHSPRLPPWTPLSLSVRALLPSARPLLVRRRSPPPVRHPRPSRHHQAQGPAGCLWEWQLCGLLPVRVRKGPATSCLRLSPCGPTALLLRCYPWQPSQMGRSARVSPRQTRFLPVRRRPRLGLGWIRRGL